MRLDIVHTQEVRGVVCALVEMQGQSLIDVKDKRRVAEIDELHTLEGVVGCGAPRDLGNEIPWYNLVKKCPTQQSTLSSCCQ
jgi:hypothetical protein